MRNFSFKEVAEATFIDLRTGETLLSLKNLESKLENSINAIANHNRKHPTPLYIKLTTQYYKKLKSKTVDLVIDSDSLNAVRFDGIPVVLDDTVDGFEFVY